MKKGTLEILWELWEPGKSIFRVVFSNITNLREEAIQPRIIAEETALERYLSHLGFSEAEVRSWIKQAKSNGSVRIENLMISAAAVDEIKKS